MSVFKKISSVNKGLQKIDGSVFNYLIVILLILDLIKILTGKEGDKKIDSIKDFLLKTFNMNSEASINQLDKEKNNIESSI